MKTEIGLVEQIAIVFLGLPIACGLIMATCAGLFIALKMFWSIL